MINQWWTTTLESVREKSLDAIEFVKKDLTDFTSTVKNDTGNYLKKIHSQPIGDFRITRIVSRLNPSENDPKKHLIPSPFYDRVHNERLRLENDESTYLMDPVPKEVYETWRDSSDFHLEDLKGPISQLLIDAPHVRSNYAQFVPACTTHADFWSRYYFRLHQLNEEEAKRIHLLKRVQEICNEKDENDWEDPGVNIDEDESQINRPLSTEIITNERRECETGHDWDNDLAIPKPESSNKSADNQSEDEWE